jgi:hypothetical protein
MRLTLPYALAHRLAGIARTVRLRDLSLRPILFALALFAASGVQAQTVGGAGTDAIPLGRGSVRVRVGGVWDAYDRTYADTGARRVLGVLQTSALGTQALPQLSAAERAIQSLSGLATFSLSLGPLEASGDVRKTTTPFVVDIGITNRLSIGVVVPYVETRNNALLVLNRAGTGANVGQNPAFTTGSGGAARTTNGTVLRQLAQARTALAAELTRCAIANATNCDAIRANTSGAQQLVQQTLDVQSAIATVYGDSARGGSPVVPISGSATQAAITARIAALRTAFVGFGITSITDGLAPASAIFVNGPGAIRRIIGDSAYGLNYGDLEGTRRAGIGDIDLTATYMLINTLGDRPSQWLAPTHLGVRTQVTGGWRFGSAGANRVGDARDVPIGDGANALLMRSTTDVIFNQRYWMSATVRIVQPLSDNLIARQPLQADSTLLAPSTVALAKRTLGRRIDLEIAPRVAVGRSFGITAGYVLHQQASDEYAFAATTTNTGATLSSPAQLYHGYLLGATFSTLGSFVRGKAKWPLEAVFSHQGPIAGSGDAPALTVDRLEIRFYTGFSRR